MSPTDTGGRRRRALLRLAGTLGVVCFILTACNVSTMYVPDPRFTRQTGAVLRVRDPYVGGFSGTTTLDIYDFRKGCPDLSVRLQSRGYEGSVQLNTGRNPETILPTDRKIVLKLDWSQITPFGRSVCLSGVMFRPEPDSEYVVVYRSPAGGGDRCGVMIGELVSGPHGDEVQPVASADPVDLRIGFTGVLSDRLCADRR